MRIDSADHGGRHFDLGRADIEKRRSHDTGCIRFVDRLGINKEEIPDAEVSELLCGDRPRSSETYDSDRQPTQNRLPVFAECTNLPIKSSVDAMLHLDRLKESDVVPDLNRFSRLVQPA